MWHACMLCALPACDMVSLEDTLSKLRSCDSRSSVDLVLCLGLSELQPTDPEGLAVSSM